VTYYRALSGLYVQDPRDAQGAFIAADEGVDLARKVQDLSAEGDNLSARAFAAIALHRPDAAEICQDAIARLYDLRFWLLVLLQIEAAAGLFATADRLREAAVIYGYLDAHQPPWGVARGHHARQRGLDRVRQLADYDLLMAQGAAIDRDELVAYSLDRLERVGPTPSGL
jgi:hypothetical protein